MIQPTKTVSSRILRIQLSEFQGALLTDDSLWVNRTWTRDSSPWCRSEDSAWWTSRWDALELLHLMMWQVKPALVWSLALASQASRWNLASSREWRWQTVQLQTVSSCFWTLSSGWLGQQRCWPFVAVGCWIWCFLSFWQRLRLLISCLYCSH